MPGSDFQDPEQGEVEAREEEWEELGCDRGAEDWTLLPTAGEAVGVVGVEMSQKIGLTLFLPSIH